MTARKKTTTTSRRTPTKKVEINDMTSDATDTPEQPKEDVVQETADTTPASDEAPSTPESESAVNEETPDNEPSTGELMSDENDSAPVNDLSPEQEEPIVPATVTEVASLEAETTAIHTVDLTTNNSLLLIDTIMADFIAKTNRKIAVTAKSFATAQSELYTALTMLEKLEAKEALQGLKIIHAYILSSINDAFDAKRRWRFAGEVQANYIKGRKWVKFTRFWNLMCDTAQPEMRKATIGQINLESQIAMLPAPLQEAIRRYFK